MIKLSFRGSDIELHDDFIIIVKGSMNSSIKIYKNEISHFILEEFSYKTNVRGGSIGASVRVAKGVYLRASSPYHKTVTHKEYTPKLVLKTFEKIAFDTISNNDIHYTLYQENIRRFSLWLKSADLNEFNNNAKIEKRKMEEEASKALDYGNIALVWFIALIISFFSGNINLIIFLFFVPGIFALFLILKDYIKRKQWGKVTVAILIVALMIYGYI